MHIQSRLLKATLTKMLCACTVAQRSAIKKALDSISDMDEEPPFQTIERLSDEYGISSDQFFVAYLTVFEESTDAAWQSVLASTKVELQSLSTEERLALKCDLKRVLAKHKSVLSRIESDIQNKLKDEDKN
jgi:hypothetical protein